MEYPLDAKLRLLCERHGPLLIFGYNDQALNFLMMEAVMDVLKKKHDPQNDQEAIAMMLALGEIKEPLCCFLGDEGFAKLTAKVPAGTGDPQRDEEIALMLAKGHVQRERQYPAPGEQIASIEGGTTYVMTLSEPLESAKGKVKEGELVSILSRVTEEERPGKQGSIEILRIEKHADARLARKWFRKLLDEKAWLREGSRPS